MPVVMKSRGLKPIDAQNARSSSACIPTWLLCAITDHSLNGLSRRLFGMLPHRVDASNAGQAPGGRQHTSWSTSCEGQRKVPSRM